MKRKFSGLLILSLLAISLGACKKDSVTPSGNGTAPPVLVSTNLFEGKVNGVLKTTTTFEFQHTNGSGSYNFNASTGLFRWGALFDETLVQGTTFNLADGDILIGLSEDGGATGYFSETGTATIVKNDQVNKQVEITFQGTFGAMSGSGTKTVTNGHMIANYTE